MNKKVAVWLMLIMQGCGVVVLNAEGSHNYAVCFVGGSGERLWPLSRFSKPKQFLPLGSDKTLLEQAVDRFDGVVSLNNVWAVTSRAYEKMMREHCAYLGTMIVEPVGKNTGPALVLSCLELYEKDPDAIVCFVPADAYIPESDYERYRTCIREAFGFVENHGNTIVLCGVKPTYPATGYGYIEYEQDHAGPIFPVSRFHEKPSLALAEQYIQQSNMLWNTCTFVGRVDTFLHECKMIASDLYESVVAYRAGTTRYEDIMAISIDCALIELSNHIAVLPVDYGWCDVGNVETFLSIKSRKDHTVRNVITVDAHNNLVDVPHRVVALVGVDDLCVVETDDVLLIVKRSEAEKVRSVVRQLRQDERTEYL